jgi:nitrous-oxide reductase
MPARGIGHRTYTRPGAHCQFASRASAILPRLESCPRLAIDRFNPVGPLHPQNHQLIDIGDKDKMQLLYDMPVPLGEPHYTVAIDATLLKPRIRYKSGTNTRTGERSPHKTRAGEERAEDQTHGFTISKYGVNGSWEPGKTASVSFNAHTPGVFPY